MAKNKCDTNHPNFKHGYRRTINGKTTPTYNCWIGIKSRCLNKNHSEWHNYGGRGITICDRWLDFKNFFEDMGERPVGLSIDRINNNGDYEPSNCRWTDHKTQCRNFRKNVIIEFNNKKMCISEWAEFLGINRKTLTARFENGYSIEQALNMNVHSKRFRRVSKPYKKHK